jgi:hypothetical protein
MVFIMGRAVQVDNTEEMLAVAVATGSDSGSSCNSRRGGTKVAEEF